VTSVLPPARRTRPPNRRELILAAATELFAARGYEYAGMSEIAEQVAVQPSALYRHFAGKEQLLAEILSQGAASKIGALRPELREPGREFVAWSALAVLQSPSFYRTELPRTEFCAEIARLAGRVVTNPSGGLLSKGHPLGATGLAQCAELVWQLRGEAGQRQVEGATLALQHNIGLGGAAVVTLYEKVS